MSDPFTNINRVRIAASERYFNGIAELRENFEENSELFRRGHGAELEAAYQAELAEATAQLGKPATDLERLTDRLTPAGLMLDSTHTHRYGLNTPEGLNRYVDGLHDLAWKASKRECRPPVRPEILDLQSVREWIDRLSAWAVERTAAVRIGDRYYRVGEWEGEVTEPEDALLQSFARQRAMTGATLADAMRDFDCIKPEDGCVKVFKRLRAKSGGVFSSVLTPAEQGYDGGYRGNVRIT